MITEIATYIGNLLYDNEIVIIPNLGGFVTAYNSSSIDHVQGLLYPPSKLISFNDNLLVNDGLLINYIREAEKCTQNEARTQLDFFVEKIQQSLKAREIVVFPEVGRLYLDYEDNLQFLPDSINYNTAVYGLPTVQYYPILRSRESALTDAELPKAASIVYAPNESKSRRWTQVLRPAVPFMIASLMVLGGIGIYTKMDKSFLNGKGRITPINLPNSNFNQSPSKSTQPFIEKEEKLDEDKVEEMISKEEELEDQQLIQEIKAEQKAREEATLAKAREEATKKGNQTEVKAQILKDNSHQEYVVIVVHSFGSQDNVDKMYKNLINGGFLPVRDKSKTLTRVGTPIPATNQKEIDRTLSILRSKYNPGAYVVKGVNAGKFK